MIDTGMGSHRSGDFVAGLTPKALETLGIDHHEPKPEARTAGAERRPTIARRE